MTYPHTDVLCCFPGIGRTTFSSEQNKEGSTFCLDLDCKGDIASFVDRVIAEKSRKAYRYILIPLNEKIRDELNKRDVRFITVTPYMHQWDAWAKRWMKAGATCETLLARLATWNAHYRDLETRDDDDDVIATVHLASDEWLGNILEQTRASAEDGRDV